MYQSECIQTILQVKTVIDRLKAIEQDILTPREREVWQESLERAYEQAASLLPLELLEEDAGKAGRRVGGKSPCYSVKRFGWRSRSTMPRL